MVVDGLRAEAERLPPVDQQRLERQHRLEAGRVSLHTASQNLVDEIDLDVAVDDVAAGHENWPTSKDSLLLQSHGGAEVGVSFWKPFAATTRLEALGV